MLPVLLAICLLVAAGGFWIWRHYFDVYHLATVQPGVLYRDGVRSAHQFISAVGSVQPKTIVSLVDDAEIAREPFVSEMNYCRDHGIDLVRIPVQLGGWPSGDQIRQFLAIANDPSRQPVLLHCAQGVRRTGMLVAAYQESVLGFNRDRAKAAILDFGHSQRTLGDVRRFIDVYDPIERRMTQELPMSSE